MEILKVENLSKVYGKGDNQVKALDNVSFGVEKGQFVAIIGPSGSGIFSAAWMYRQAVKSIWTGRMCMHRMKNSWQYSGEDR